ncbi:MAG TPA: hypothetical protein VFA71_04960 [Terriglobales bacterium]|nr:hypothetical protein [Terriglobales bacterium]
MEATLKKLRIVQISLIGWLALLIYLMERMPLHSAPKTLKPAVLWTIAAFGVYLTIMIFAYRVRRLSPAREKLRLQPTDVVTLRRWQLWNIVSLVLSESLGFYGICLRVLGASFFQAAGFYAGALVLLLLFTPRRP